MQIIGEKINGTRKSVAKAIEQRNTEAIQNLAIKQAEAGAHWLDINAGTPPDQEIADLPWLVETIQSVVDIPLSLDSANPKALSTALERTSQTPLINSISGERQRLENILPLVVEHQCPVIVLLMNEKGIPKTVETRLEVLDWLMDTLQEQGLAHDQLYIDPLTLTLGSDSNSGAITVETIRSIRLKYPDVHISVGLSNISFGLPARSVINRTYLTLALQAGLDTAIMDPIDNELMSAIYATNLMLGKDRYCQKYIRANRSRA